MAVAFYGRLLMKKYAVIMNGTLIYVYLFSPLYEVDKSEITGGSIALFVSPSQTADIRIETLMKAKITKIEPRALLAALSFLNKAVGFCSACSTVELFGKVYKMGEDPDGYATYDLNAFKCKDILSYCGQNMHDVLLSMRYRLLKAFDAEAVESGWLSRIRMLYDAPVAAASAAFTLGSDILLKHTSVTFPYELYAAVISVVGEYGINRVGSITANGESTEYVLLDGSRAMFFIRLKYLGALD